jgi:ABC-2 type transport system ATP-binding protein
VNSPSAHSPRPPAIETRGLTKLYGSRPAVHDLALQVGRGEVFGFLGQNGAGKTTTIRLLLGLIRPTLGDVLLFGEPLASARLRVLARVGALVEGPAFYPFLSGEKNLLLIGNATGGTSVERVRECLDRVGLLERKDDHYRGYSRGMKQRLGIALAILHKPDLVILDEPLNGLDPPAILRIRKLIRDLAEVERTTVFVSSHLLHEVELSCDRVAIIEKSRLVAQGSVDDLLRPDHDVIEVEADDLDAALAVARGLSFVRSVQVEAMATRDPRTRRAPPQPTTAEGRAPGSDTQSGAPPPHADGARLHLVAEIELGRAADLNQALVSAGRAVRALVPRRRTLEDLFHDFIKDTRRATRPGVTPAALVEPAEAAEPEEPGSEDPAEEAARRG